MLYTMAGSVLMLVAILSLAYLNDVATGSYSFDLLKLYDLQLSERAQFWGFLAFAVAFAIKVPLFPFHTWLPDAHVEAPTAGSVILAGVLLKMGTYGLLRFAFPLFPDAALYFAPYLAGLAVIGIIYGALVAMVQPDLKKLIAYSSVSHLGFVVLGIASMNVQGVEGAVYQMLNHGVSTGALFLIVGMLSDRRHTRLIAEFGGLKKVMPHLTAVFLIVTLASIGLPGLNGFVGEFLILLGAFEWDPRFASFAAVGVILSAAYMLWMFQRVNYGEVTNAHNAHLPDLSRREWWMLAPTVVMVIVMGLVPTLFLRPMEPSVDRLVERVRRAQALTAQRTSARRSLSQPARSSDLKTVTSAGALSDYEGLSLFDPYIAIVPALCVTLGGLAAMMAEAFREPDERVPIGGLAIVALVAAGLSSALLWGVTPPASAWCRLMTSRCSSISCSWWSGSHSAVLVRCPGARQDSLG